ncbi:MAG: DUF4867 family protein, partial [Eubacteriaceae bacterium]
MKIYSINDPEFAPYGKIIDGYNTASLVSALKAGPMPENVSYTASDPLLEKMNIMAELTVN